MRIRFLTAARREFSEAVSYYDSKEPSRATNSPMRFGRTISRIASHPSAWQQLSSRTRRCLTRRFHYAVIYRSQPNSLLIIAVMHLKRDPDS